MGFCHNPNNSTTQPQHCSFDGYANSCETPPTKHKLNGSPQGRQINIDTINIDTIKYYVTSNKNQSHNNNLYNIYNNNKINSL